MRAWRRPLHRFARRLAWLALAVQATLPLLLAMELRAEAAQAEAAIFDHSLCLHDGGASPSDQAPHQDCNLSACPLCTLLAASSVLALAGQGGALAPLRVARTEPVLAADRTSSARPLFARPYRSRAPPSA